jgi:hypothetical protein
LAHSIIQKPNIYTLSWTTNYACTANFKKHSINIKFMLEVICHRKHTFCKKRHFRPCFSEEVLTANFPIATSYCVLDERLLTFTSASFLLFSLCCSTRNRVAKSVFLLFSQFLLAKKKAAAINLVSDDNFPTCLLSQNRTCNSHGLAV